MSVLKEVMNGEALPNTFEWCEKAFKVAGWIAIVAAFKLVADKTNSLIVYVFYVALSLLLVAFFFNLAAKIKVARFAKLSGWRFWLYSIVRLAVVFAVYAMANHSIDVAVDQIAASR